MNQIDELLSRGVANIIPNKEELKKKLESGEKLNIYLGIDPTSTQIHLGHAFPLRQLQRFADLGHHVTFLIGDFTALIGDTSDKESERPVLTSEQIQDNFKTYKQQAEKILDFSKITVKHNSEWLSKLTFAEIVKLCQHFSFGDFASRELIKKRLTAGTPVGLHEALYPVMQGYDSYHLDTDIQLGGTDQTFNMQAGRTLQKDLRHKQSFVMTNEFLEGTDGRKMSKSWGNAIWLTDAPNEMYGKIMSLKDELIVQYFLLGTNVSMSKVKEVEKRLNDGENPMILKKELAFEIVKELHSEKDAEAAASHFESVFQKDQIPEDIRLFTFDINSMELIDLVEHLFKDLSRSEIKRLLEQGGIEIDGKKMSLSDTQIELKEGQVVKVGKNKFAKIHIK